MDRILHIVGKNSSEVFMLRYPRALLNFCDYDFTYFAENAIAVCEEALRTGELDYDRVTELRNSLKSAHPCIENNIRTVYDKVVIDCWIDFLCRRDNVGTNALWNRFIGCTTGFEKTVFARLCDYRYNKAINEWLNLVRVQDYAKNKISYIFSVELNSAEEAAARRNYFDLMFSVTARELGCRIDELGVTKVFSVGRIPSAPFMFPNISKDIVKNLLADFDYSEDYSDNDNYGGLSDQIAMDAFSHMKRGLAQEYTSYNISRSAMENSPIKVYMPYGMKAVADLEIDALIESGGWLSRCRRCGRYFVRDAEYTEEYCSLFNPGSNKTCLEIYEMEHPRSVISAELEKQYSQVIDIMYDRVGEGDMSLHEYESWKTYIDALHEKVENKEIPIDELESFIRYSRSLDISRSNPVKEVVRRPESEQSRERVVRPFVPERIDRNSLPKPQPVVEEEPDEEEYIPRPSAKRAFFTSPSVERQKNREQAPVTHIIRGGEQLEQHQPSQGFVPFGAQQPVASAAVQPVSQPTEPMYSAEPVRSKGRQAVTPIYRAERADAPAASAYTPASFDFGQPAAKQKPERQQNVEQSKPSIPENKTEKPTMRRETYDAEQQAVFELFDRMYAEQTAEESRMKPDYTSMQQTVEPEAAPEPVAEEPPKPKVIRKNAAAMSAYGKMSGTPMMSAFEQVSRPEPVVDEEPFKDVGTIFDVLEQSEVEMTDDALRSFAQEQPYAEPESAPAEQPKPVSTEPVRPVEPEKPAESVAAAVPVEPAAVKQEVMLQSERLEQAMQPDKPVRVVPDRVTASNAPSGVWSEDRNLFADSDSSEESEDELAILKEKKRRTAKTQRLFDAIMREPEDNPNVRRSKK